MKTVQDIQKEVLATAQVTLDELQASIEKFWEQGWERNEEAKEPVSLLNGTLTISQESFVIMLLIKTCTRKSCQANM